MQSVSFMFPADVKFNFITVVCIEYNLLLRSSSNNQKIYFVPTRNIHICIQDIFRNCDAVVKRGQRVRVQNIKIGNL